MIYNKYDLLDLIYKQVIMRIIEANNSSDKEKNKSNIPTTSVMPTMNRAQMAGTVAAGMLNQNYLPSAEEIKLGARAFASMPFSILQTKNPLLSVDQQDIVEKFSITGYFKALLKIIDNGYGVAHQPVPHQIMSNAHLKSQEESQAQQDKIVAK